MIVKRSAIVLKECDAYDVKWTLPGLSLQTPWDLAPGGIVSNSSPDAHWLAPTIEAMAAITTSAAPVEYKIRSACRAILDHVNAAAVWILGWPPGEEMEARPAQVLGCECDDDFLGDIVKAKNQAANNSWVRRLQLFSAPTYWSHDTIVETCFNFESRRFVVVCSPMLAHGRVLGYVIVVTHENDIRSEAEWSQLRVTARVMGMALRSSVEYHVNGSSDFQVLRLKALATTLPGSSVMLNESGKILQIFPGQKPVPHVIARGKDWVFDFSSPEQRQEHEKTLALALTGQSVRCRIYVQGEKSMVMEHFFEPIRIGTNSKVREVVCFMRDVTEILRLQAIIRSMKQRDPVTGCLTLLGITEYGPKEIEFAQREGRECVVFAIELENASSELQLPGSGRVDDLLKGLVARMHAMLPMRHIVARRGEYSFVVVAQLGPRMPSAADLSASFMQGMRQPIIVGRAEYVMSSSIGHAVFPLNGDSFNNVLSGADIAAIFAYRAGRNHAVAFHPDMARDAADRSQMEARLHRAVDNEEFSLVFQPKIRLNDSSVSGVEALLRWTGKDAISPDKFIPIAEECGLISYIGEWVLRKSCATAKKWAEKGFRIPVSVNVSSRQFHDNDFHTVVREVLEETGCDPTLIEIEITEGVMFSDPAAAILSFGQLKAMGLGVSIDDFGMGFSSLSYLKNIPADAVKIDKTFVTGLPGATDNVAITKAIIAMAGAMNLRVIAEGVEDLRCLEHLRAMGCDEAQGFYFSHPLKEDELLRWYEAYRYKMV